MSHLAPDLSRGGHFADQFLGALLLRLAVRGLVRGAGTGRRSHHVGVDPRRRRKLLLRLLAKRMRDNDVRYSVRAPCCLTACPSAPCRRAAAEQLRSDFPGGQLLEATSGVITFAS